MNAYFLIFICCVSTYFIYKVEKQRVHPKWKAWGSAFAIVFIIFTMIAFAVDVVTNGKSIFDYFHF